MIKEQHIHASLAGRLRIAVLEADRIVEKRDWESNLILDQGLDLLATVTFNQLFAACCVGNGSDVTNIRPAATATASGTNLTASAPTFSTADLDSDVRFDTGQYAKIQSVTDSQHITLFSSITVSTPTAFTILRTNQAILENEIQRTVQCSAVPNANLTIDEVGTLLLQRTFLFPPATTAETFTEVGFSNLAVAGANLFSRVLLSTPVTLQGPAGEFPGQQLQVTYQLGVGFDFGRGSGVYFAGTTPTTITISGLPLSSAIFNYASAPSPNVGQLQISVSPQTTAVVGNMMTISGSNVAAYNGSHKVLTVINSGDATHGATSIVTLNVAYSSNPSPDGGQLKGPSTGQFFRPNYGIYWINSIGGQVAPPNRPDVFWGFGEPSIAGQAWISLSKAAQLGSNRTPLRATGAQIVLCNQAPYTKGNFYIDETATFEVIGNQAFSSFGYGLPDLTNQIETWTWDLPQALGDTSQLILTFRFSWNRTSF
jgi:hypothetical protein